MNSYIDIHVALCSKLKYQWFLIIFFLLNITDSL